MKLPTSGLLLAIILPSIFLPVDSWAIVSSDVNPPSMNWVLKPGDIGLCNKDFLIYNMDNTKAEYMVTVGNEIVEKDALPVHENRFFDLGRSVARLRHEGNKNIQEGGKAVVINTGKNAKVGLDCR